MLSLDVLADKVIRGFECSVNHQCGIRVTKSIYAPLEAHTNSSTIALRLYDENTS